MGGNPLDEALKEAYEKGRDDSYWSENLTEEKIEAALRFIRDKYFF